VNGVNGILIANSKITNVRIFPTHFHHDHVQALAGLIYQTSSSKLTVTLYIPVGLILEYAGWYLDNYQSL
jgi:ribonuclease BN (tRNA processing enzyme)